MEDFDFQKQYEIGYPIFEQLFKLSDKDLKVKLLSILNGNEGCEEILKAKNSGVTKEIHNEKYRNIKISFYDYIDILPFGIYYHPEHGTAKSIIKFNEHFKL